jgi:hypothetical protein
MIEDPWVGIRSTNRVWIGFMIMIAVAPTAREG